MSKGTKDCYIRLMEPDVTKLFTFQ